MNTQNILIEAAPRGLKSQRLVVARHTDTGDELYRHKFDTDSGVSRNRFIKEIAKRTNTEVDELDWLDAEIVDAATEADDMAFIDDSCDLPDSEDKDRKSHATMLVELASELELFHSPHLDAYVCFPVDDHLETSAVRSQAFRRWLSREFYFNHGKTPGGQAMQDAISVLEDMALFEGEEHVVHIRVAKHNDKVYIDLPSVHRTGHI